MKKTVQLSMLLAFSIVLSLLESLLPFLNGMIPGLKLGLANIIVVFVLYEFESKDAIKCSLLRVVIVSILRNSGIFFFFSFLGALFSSCMMVISKKATKLSIIGVSVVGSFFHSLGQLVGASIFLNQQKILSLFPIFILVSIPTGILIGYISKECVKYYERRLKFL